MDSTTADGAAMLDRFLPEPDIRERHRAWGLLAEEPGRLYVSGASCQPWLADVIFSPLAPESFAAYDDPNRVKIVWSIETQPRTPEESSLATETRAAGTDAEARRKFLPYYRRMRPGIIGIRWLMLGAIRRRAEAVWKGGGA